MKYSDIKIILGELVDLNSKINNNLKIEILKLINEEKVYIVGFLDGDGVLLI